MNNGYIAKIEVDSTELDMIIASLKATRKIHNNLEKLDELIESLEEVKYMNEDEIELFDNDF